VGLNNKSAAGQAVPHLHWHVIPRFKNDGGGSMHSIVKTTEEIDVKKISELFA
jgi:histidine triad (HIT) family protein